MSVSCVPPLQHLVLNLGEFLVTKGILHVGRRFQLLLIYSDGLLVCRQTFSFLLAILGINSI